MPTKLFIALLLLALMSLPTFGDIARPKPSPNSAKLVTSIVVIPQMTATEARLEIPEQLWKEMQAGLIEPGENPTFAQKIAQSSPRTIIAGLFLFLSVALTGVWLARSGQKNQRVVAAILLVAAVFAGATIISRANAGPPPYVRWQNLSKALSEGTAASMGRISVVIVPQGNNITLVVPIGNSDKKRDEE